MENFCQVFNPHYFAIELREALHERVIEVMSFSLLDESLSPANHVRPPSFNIFNSYRCVAAGPRTRLNQNLYSPSVN